MSKNNKTLKQLRREQNITLLNSKGLQTVRHHSRAHIIDFYLQLAMNRLLDIYSKDNKHKNNMKIEDVFNMIKVQKVLLTKNARVRSQDEQGQNVTESTSCLYDGNPDRTTFPCPNCAHDIDLLSPPKYPIKRK